MKVDIPGDTGNVISLKVVRDHYQMRKLRKECLHIYATLDTVLANLTCDDCKKELNPIEYIVHLAERWKYVDRMTAHYKKWHLAYEHKKRTKCEHCGKLTNVRPAK